MIPIGKSVRTNTAEATLIKLNQILPAAMKRSTGSTNLLGELKGKEEEKKQRNKGREESNQYRKVRMDGGATEAISIIVFVIVRRV